MVFACTEEIENVKRKYRNPTSVALTCGFITTGFHCGNFSRNASIFFFGKAISEIALTTRKGSLFTWSGRESYNRAGGGGADEYNSLF